MSLYKGKTLIAGGGVGLDSDNYFKGVNTFDSISAVNDLHITDGGSFDDGMKFFVQSPYDGKLYSMTYNDMYSILSSKIIKQVGIVYRLNSGVDYGTGLVDKSLWQIYEELSGEGFTAPAVYRADKTYKERPGDSSYVFPAYGMRVSAEYVVPRDQYWSVVQDYTAYGSLDDRLISMGIDGKAALAPAAAVSYCVSNTGCSVLIPGADEYVKLSAYGQATGVDQANPSIALVRVPAGSKMFFAVDIFCANSILYTASQRDSWPAQPNLSATSYNYVVKNGVQVYGFSDQKDKNGKKGLTRPVITKYDAVQ